MKKISRFLLMMMAATVIVTLGVLGSCKKMDDAKPDKQVVKPVDPQVVKDFEMKIGGSKYLDGDTAWCAPGIPVVFAIPNPPAGAFYTWNFCGTILTGSLTNIQTNINYTFSIPGNCTVTITQNLGGVITTKTLYVVISVNDPFVPPLYFLSSFHNTDGTYEYYWGVRKDRISDQTGTLFQIGDHTLWVKSFINISTTPTDSLIRFNFRTYNQVVKFNAGRGVTFSDVSGSIWKALGWPADNNYQPYLEDGVVRLNTYTPTIVAPGLVGDDGTSSRPLRITVDASGVAMFLQVSNNVAGSKEAPYVTYKIGTNAWSGNVPLTWFNGYGWTSAPIIPAGSIPAGGTIISVLFGATGGAGAMGGSIYYNPATTCLQFQVTSITCGPKIVYSVTPVVQR